MKYTTFTISILVLALLSFTGTVSAQKILMENCNSDTLSAGFSVSDTAGFVEPGGDGATWYLMNTPAWEWGWTNEIGPTRIYTEPITADAFTIECGFSEMGHVPGSDWDVVMIDIVGLDSLFRLFLGSAASDGQVLPARSLYFEIQNPDKNNGYMWGSDIHGNVPVLPPFSEYIDVFPDNVEVRVEFNGPQQPMDVYYKFDGGAWTHHLQYGDTDPVHTFSDVASGGPTYQVSIGPGAGSLGTFDMKLDYLSVRGPITSDRAVVDPSFTDVNDWGLY